MSHNGIAKIIKPMVLVSCPVRGKRVKIHWKTWKKIDLDRGCLAQWWMEWMFLHSQGLTCKARCIQYIPYKWRWMV